MLLKAFYHQVGSLRETKDHRLSCTLSHGLPASGVLLRLAWGPEAEMETP